MNRCHLSGIAVLVLTTALLSGDNAGKKQSPPTKAINPVVAALIDKLAEVAEADTGYNPSVSGSAFAPLRSDDHWETMIFGQKPSVRSDVFRELVKLGPAAVPDLVGHLNDKRPTRLTVRHTFGAMGGLWTNEENRGGEPNAYTLKIGDLCYVALGQVVNRRHNAVWYQPTAIIMVFTLTCDPETCDKLKKEWGELTRDKHRQSLLKDCEGKGDVSTRAGAFLRLGWYYPEALEEPALRFLARPAYSLWDSSEFVRNKLYKETDGKKRREVFDSYVKQFGETGRDGIRDVLFFDLDTLEADEEKRLFPPGVDFGKGPRQLLIDLYGAPKSIRSKDKPESESISTSHVREVIENGLIYDRSAKIDRAVSGLLAKTTDESLALACMKRLIGRGFDAEMEAWYRRHEKVINEYTKNEFKEILEKAGWSSLHVAVWRGESERLMELLREGAKVNARAKDGQTPLHVAAAAGNIQAIKPLLAAGADQKATNSQGLTPVGLASFKSNIATVRELVSAGGLIPDLLVAATVGNAEETARFLRMDKAAHRAKDSQGRTPLHRAALEGQQIVMRQLLDSGADVDAPDKNGLTPLHVAAALGHKEACHLLVQRKAAVDAAIPESGSQPIHLAAGNGRIEVVQLLVKKGAKVDAHDSNKGTPLQDAAEHGHLAVVQWLVEQKADVNAKNKNGWSALSLALRNGHKEVAALLIKNGANKSPFD